jgi:hypothetical protein
MSPSARVARCGRLGSPDSRGPEVMLTLSSIESQEGIDTWRRWLPIRNEIWKPICDLDSEVEVEEQTEPCVQVART